MRGNSTSSPSFYASMGGSPHISQAPLSLTDLEGQLKKGKMIKEQARALFELLEPEITKLKSSNSHHLPPTSSTPLLPAATPHSLYEELKSKLDELQQLCTSTHQLLYNQNVNTTNINQNLIYQAKQEQKQLEKEAQSMKLNLSVMEKDFDFAPQNSTASTAVHANSAADQLRQRKALLDGAKGPNSGNHLLKIDTLYQENSGLRSAHSLADTTMQMVHSTLGELNTQNATIWGAVGRVNEVLSNLTMSNRLLRVIQRREKVDKYILFGMMFGLLLIIVILYYYFRWR